MLENWNTCPMNRWLCITRWRIMTNTVDFSKFIKTMLKGWWTNDPMFILLEARLLADWNLNFFYLFVLNGKSFISTIFNQRLFLGIWMDHKTNPYWQRWLFSPKNMSTRKNKPYFCYSKVADVKIDGNTKMILKMKIFMWRKWGLMKEEKSETVKISY